jgi:nucleotide-binding universal stress UspA family protein
MLKSFFAAYNGSPAAGAALEQCCFLASLTHGRIHLGNIVELSYEPAIATGMAAGSLEYTTSAPPIQAIDDLENFRKERESQAETYFGEGRRLCGQWTVACDTRCLLGYLEEEILNQARAVDILALGQSDAGSDPRKIGHLTEAIVRSSPQPVLIAKAPFAKPTEILILDNGGDRSLHALCVGAEIARRANLALELITVTPTREEGEAVSQRGIQYLGDQEVPFQNSIVAAPDTPDRELVTRLNNRPSALVLMGAFGESRLKEWLSGSTTRTIMQETRNPLILFRH